MNGCKAQMTSSRPFLLLILPSTFKDDQNVTQEFGKGWKNGEKPELSEFQKLVAVL